MKKITYFAAFILIFIMPGCNGNHQVNTNTDTAAGTLNQTLDFVIKTYTKQTTLPCELCPEVEVSIPVAEGDPGIAQKINDSVFSAVQSILSWENKPADNYDSLLAHFIKTYEETAAEMPEGAVLGWSGTVNGSVVKKTNTLVNIMLDTYTMTGGAHGNAAMTSLLFDPVTGNKLSLKDVVKDVPGFTALAETTFREKLDIPANASLNADMFTFTDDKFALPENIFFINDSLLLHYNSYEIGPYAIGATDITIPYSKAEAYLATQP